MTEIPRRARIDLFTPAEKAIREAIIAVESAALRPVRDLFAALDRACPGWKEETMVPDGDEVNDAWRALDAALAPRPEPAAEPAPEGEGASQAIHGPCAATGRGALWTAWWDEDGGITLRCAACGGTPLARLIASPTPHSETTEDR